MPLPFFFPCLAIDCLLRSPVETQSSVMLHSEFRDAPNFYTILPCYRTVPAVHWKPFQSQNFIGRSLSKMRSDYLGPKFIVNKFNLVENRVVQMPIPVLETAYCLNAGSGISKNMTLCTGPIQHNIFIRKRTPLFPSSPSFATDTNLTHFSYCTISPYLLEATCEATSSSVTSVLG